ncbi:DUF1175 family protein [Undibacterium pigrum]|uniref:DUF1175 domain-containing protein n=1 Tax=Undibacterium pigrum TaxID=401470 RepID=A0A318IXV5_9BURK|nr:DUF1175 family protein [Undibacterium pigrum]PXX39803.1 hypothetical protein DFR42_110169 [Undibacterium pigrum]
MKRRHVLTGMLATGTMLGWHRLALANKVTSPAVPLPAASAARAGTTTTPVVSAPTLTPAQSRSCRAWMTRIIAAQLTAGPTPRWQQRDCVGLVRFAVAESLREHDEKWKRANGMLGTALPPEIDLDQGTQSVRHQWRLADGTVSAYVSAIEMVQENARFRGKDCNLAAPGDLLFFDQGDAQHLMVWMNSYIAYHTGTVTPTDNGLRAVKLRDLRAWRDTRWHPTQDNPNFAGVYRLNFLSA